METPDSIYIFTDGDERWYDVKEWEGRTPPPANVEYIRKDALIEWLEQNRNQAQMWFDRYNDREDLSAKQVLEEVIAKINDL